MHCCSEIYRHSEICIATPELLPSAAVHPRTATYGCARPKFWAVSHGRVQRSGNAPPCVLPCSVVCINLFTRWRTVNPHGRVWQLHKSHKNKKQNLQYLILVIIFLVKCHHRDPPGWIWWYVETHVYSWVNDCPFYIDFVVVKTYPISRISIRN